MKVKRRAKIDSNNYNSNLLFSNQREDISFHFSLGFTALMRRFTGNKSFNSGSSKFLFGGSNAQSNYFSNQPMDRKEMQSMSMRSFQEATSGGSSNLNPFSYQNDNTSNMIIMLQGMQMVASKSNVVLFAVGGIVWKGLGWKILAITASLYGLCYLYERLMWTRKTQEKLFKRQYADFASSKLRLIVDLTSQNAASQVQQYAKYIKHNLK